MKILLYGLNFAPEPTGIGKYSGELAAWLASRGHEVRVIAAPPYYPSWQIAPGYSGWKTVRESWQGVSVWRTPLWVPSQPSGSKRVLHLLSFALGSVPVLVRQLFWKPDAVVVVAPALVCAPGGLLAARLCGAKAWLHIQDFEVDAAFRMGLLRGKLSQRIVGWCERAALRRFDRVSTISNRMMMLLRSKGVADLRAVSFPNWVDIQSIAPPARDAASSAQGYRAELGIADDAIVALYSGSMAGKQGLELLPAAARELAQRVPNLVFVLCGDGVYKPSIERDCAGLANVRLLPLQPARRLGELLHLADIHLLPQHVDAADLVMPSKLTGILASGRPVVTTAQTGTELADVVAGRGIVVPPSDLPGFCDALATLAGDAPLRAELGAAARRYAESYLARDRVLTDFEYALRRCLGEVAPSAEPGETHEKTHGRAEVFSAHANGLRQSRLGGALSGDDPDESDMGKLTP